MRGVVVYPEEESEISKNLLKLLIGLLVMTWVVCGLLAVFSTPSPVAASTLSSGWVLGHYAANPDEEIVLVDTLSKLYYSPPNPYYQIPGIPQDYTLVTFESTQGSSDTFKALFISGNITGSFKEGDKVVIRFTLNQFIAGMPATMNALPTSTIQHYSPLSTFNLTPLIAAAAITAIIVSIIVWDIIRKKDTSQFPPQPPIETHPN